jgi:hypothetical protein
MDDGWKILIGITVICCIGINALICVVGMDYPNGFAVAGIQITSGYQYEVTLTGTGTAENVTLMIPLPSAGGDSPVGDAILSGAGEGIRSDWTLEQVGTGDAVFLKMTAPSLSFADGPVIFGAAVPAPSLINTADPAENTCLLRPKENIAQAADGMEYTSPLYASCDMPGAGGIDIVVHLDGANTWRYPVDTGNHFTDTLTLTGDGQTGGWQTADGTLTIGIGKYSVI